MSTPTGPLAGGQWQGQVPDPTTPGHVPDPTMPGPPGHPPPSWPPPPPPPSGWQAPRPGWNPPPPRPPKNGRRWPTSGLVLAAGLAFLAGLLVGAAAGVAGNDDDGDDTVTATLPAPTTTPTTTVEEGTTTTTVEGDDDVRTHSGNEENPPQADVGPVECTRDQFGDLKATAPVTNHSSERSDYIVTIAFESPDGTTQLEASSGYIQDLEPGQSAPLEVVTGTDAPAEFTCRVTEVERFASL